MHYNILINSNVKFILKFHEIILTLILIYAIQFSKDSKRRRRWQGSRKKCLVARFTAPLKT